MTRQSNRFMVPGIASVMATRSLNQRVSALYGQEHTQHSRDGFLICVLIVMVDQCFRCVLELHTNVIGVVLSSFMFLYNCLETWIITLGLS